MSWKPLGSTLPQALTEARLELHWAAQLVSAAGSSLLPPATDFSHTNLGWMKSVGVLAGRPVGDRGLQAGLVFEGLELVVLDGDRERASLALAGHTLEDGRRWLAESLGEHERALRLPEHDMPSHAVGEGGPFSGAHTDGRRELAAWFADATQLISVLVADEETASAVRCWPHHFDVASLLTFDPDADPEEARSLGIGFSPGDGSYDQPYFYVNPWPYPDSNALPELRAGASWHTEDWTGAVLTADRMISVPHDDQEEQAGSALREAIEVGKRVLQV